MITRRTRIQLFVFALINLVLGLIPFLVVPALRR